VREARALWLLFSLFIVYGATIPFSYAGGEGFLERLAAVPLNPLVAPDTGRRLSIPDAVQNVLLFVPFGALGVAAAARSARGAGRIALVTTLGLALSVAVELLQLLMSNRVTSTGDVMTNTVGASAGALGAGIAIRLTERARRRLAVEGLTGPPELRPALVSAGVLAVAFLQPFDVTLEIGAISWKVHALESDIWQRTIWRDEGIVVLVASLFAMAGASYWKALGEHGAAVKIGFLGTLAVVGLEAGQLLVTSRMPGLWDAGVGAAGIWLGATLWALSGRVDWPVLWWAILVLMTAFAAGLQMLSPFDWVSTYRGFSWFPLYGYYQRTTFETLSHVIELALAYFPLGYCLTYGAPSPRRTLVLSLALTLAIAAPVEALQGWVAGRYADGSDVAVGLLGAWAGWRLARTRL
jgi:glycopeptide antibiotics resistance protein